MYSELFEMFWAPMWKKLGAKTDPYPIFHHFQEVYSQPGRYYHNFDHIDFVVRLASILEARAVCSNHAAVLYTLFSHDYDHDTHRNDNEERSADKAVTFALEAGVEKEIAESVRPLVLVTKHNKRPTNDQEKLVVDVDLSILGADEETFFTYEQNIRKEYAWVEEGYFRQKRKEILQEFLLLAKEDTLYSLPFAKDMFTERARRNLAHSIEMLS
jgi:predicted metal-dependent HD superfamily phosphohydrolase